MSNTRTVLVVDDEQPVRKVLKRILERGGMHVLTADSVGAAEKILAEEPVDAVLSDYQLPGESGLSFLERLHMSHPSLVRVLTTGFGDMQLALQAINQAKVHYFLAKPFEPEDVLRCLGQLMDAKSREHPSPAADSRDRRREALGRLREAFPGIDVVDRNTRGHILLQGSRQAASPGRVGDPRPGQSLRAEAVASKRPEPLDRAPRHPTVLRELESAHPGISSIERTATGSIFLDEDEYQPYLDTSEYKRPPGLRPSTIKQAKQREITRGASPLCDLMELPSAHPTGRKSAEEPSPFDIDLVFDESFLKLIGE